MFTATKSEKGVPAPLELVKGEDDAEREELLRLIEECEGETYVV